MRKPKQITLPAWLSTTDIGYL